MEAFVLGGSWPVISGVISRVTIIITHIGGLITPLITPHEPPSKESQGLVPLPATKGSTWEFPKIRGTLCWGVLIIRFLLFRVLC